MKYITFVLITKSRFKQDILDWYNFHNYYSEDSEFIIINNESREDLKILKSFENVHYFELEGWPDQYNLYNDILYDLKTKYATFIDDDEFWIPGQTLLNINEGLEWSEKRWRWSENGILYCPWNMMSTKDYMLYDRNTNLLDTFRYRKRYDQGIQGKCWINLESKKHFKFNHEGHAPLVNGTRDYISSVGGKFNGIYCIQDIDEEFVPMRICHYHIKSKLDWIFKIKRGSAATPNQWYDNDVKNNLHYGNYNEFYDYPQKLYQRMNVL